MRNISGNRVSLQVSTLMDIDGDRKFATPVLLKNITDEDITCDVLLPNNLEYTQTILYPGWNPELVTGVRGIQNNLLQYGF